MDWLTNVVISIIGAAAWSTLVIATKLAYERAGPLAGKWYQVTYYADDQEMVGIPWSVEIVRVRHRKVTTSGSMLRVHSPHTDRRWQFLGRYEDAYLDALYWSTRGDGGKGSLHLWRVSHNNLRGRFVESQIVHQRENLNIVYLEAPIEWIRISSREEARILPWLDYGDNLAPRHIPRWALRIIRRGLSNYTASFGEPPTTRRRQLLEGLAYAGSVVDLTGPLAMEAEKKRRQATTETSSPGEPIMEEISPQGTSDTAPPDGD